MNRINENWLWAVIPSHNPQGHAIKNATGFGLFAFSGSHDDYRLPFGRPSCDAPIRFHGILKIARL